MPVKSETGSYIQDASFHSQIYVPLDAERFTLIRFSNFGDMATVNEDEPVPEEMKQAIIDLIEKHGYVYIPATVLDQPYTREDIRSIQSPRTIETYVLRVRQFADHFGKSPE